MEFYISPQSGQFYIKKCIGKSMVVCNIKAVYMYSSLSFVSMPHPFHAYSLTRSVSYFKNAEETDV